MQKPTHAPVLDATHLSHILLLNPMETILLYSLADLHSNLTSTRDMKVMVSRVSLSSAISVWMEIW